MSVTIKRVYDEPEAGDGERILVDRLCEASVAAQVERLARTPTLTAAWQAGRDVSIHGWVYGLQDGLLSDLKCTVRGNRGG